MKVTVAGMLLSLLLVLAHPLRAEIEISEAWARATAPGMPMGAVYGLISNHGDKDVTLLSLKTDAARLAEIHESVEVNGMMRMREITPFVIPAGGAVRLQPGGKHIMLMGLKDALVEGESLTVRAEFDDGSDQPVSAVIGGFGQMEMPE